ncbi:MAG: hypothetical protein J6P69_07170 [Bacteroidales bacterium]|nr:hypothetical protein [Bacteroidales bacterium]
MKKLKKLLTITVSVILCAGCTVKEESNGISHLAAFRDRYQDSRREGGGGVLAVTPMDTSVFVVAVEFPEGYDWRRDSSYGAVSGSLALYRDGERTLSIPAGPGLKASLDPDLHHLVDGHLYTESCTVGETVISKDGEELFSYPGREFLCGLLVEGGDIYTLGQSRSGSGFSLRRNGGEIITRSDGSVASHMSDNPEYQGGALYRDGGHLYFSYWKPLAKGSALRVWYIVEDGEETAVDAAPEGIYDIRVLDGDLKITPRSSKTSWERWSYTDGKWNASVMVYKDGNVIVAAPFDNSRRYYFNDHLLFSFRNACLSGKHFYIGLNPPDRGESPSLWLDGETDFRLEINGFITEVGVSVERKSP